MTTRQKPNHAALPKFNPFVVIHDPTPLERDYMHTISQIRALVVLRESFKEAFPSAMKAEMKRLYQLCCHTENKLGWIYSDK